MRHPDGEYSCAMFESSAGRRNEKLVHVLRKTALARQHTVHLQPFINSQTECAKRFGKVSLHVGSVWFSLVDPGSIWWNQGLSGGSRVSLVDPGLV